MCVCVWCVCVCVVCVCVVWCVCVCVWWCVCVCVCVCGCVLFLHHHPFMQHIEMELCWQCLYKRVSVHMLASVWGVSLTLSCPPRMCLSQYVHSLGWLSVQFTLFAFLFSASPQISYVWWCECGGDGRLGQKWWLSWSPSLFTPSC